MPPTAGWYHTVQLDDILWKEYKPEKVYQNLDFEDASDLDYIKKGNISNVTGSYAGNQSLSIAEEADGNHVLEVGSVSNGWDNNYNNNAYMVYHTPEKTVGDFELSFQMKWKADGDNASKSNGLWIRSNGTENGYRFSFDNDKISINH